LENTVVVGSNLFATEAGGFAIEDWNGIPFDCTITTPSNETCSKITNIPSLLLGPAGESGLQNTRQVMRIGNNYRPSCYEEVHYIWDDIALATRHDLQAMNIPYSQHTYDIYDVPFPTIGLIAQMILDILAVSAQDFLLVMVKRHILGFPVSQLLWNDSL